MIVYACSSNPGKLREFQLAAVEFGSTGLSLVALPQLPNLKAPDETGTTFEENASLKAIYYSQFTDQVVLADDSGIEVEALQGAPGIRSARYAGPASTAQANMNLLLSNMHGKTNRNAQFVCSIALCQYGKLLHSVRATVRGTLLDSPQGEGGFGYDPLFFYPPFGCTFGELGEVRKFNVSHRGSALRQVVSWLDKTRR